MLQAAAVAAAAGRLEGHLVATPLIGAVLLPGFTVPATLRVKAECLQSGGSLAFRGAKHHLLRQLGGNKGLVVHGSRREVLAGAVAAGSHRLPVVAVVIGAGGGAAGVAAGVAAGAAAAAGAAEPQGQVLVPEDAVDAMLRQLGCEVVAVPTAEAARACAQELRQQRGYQVLPRLDGVDYALGIATLGLELARELPADIAAVVMAPADLAVVVEAGLRAGGCACPVRGVDADASALPEGLACAVRAGLRIECDAEGLAALAAVVAEPRSNGAGPVCVVLSS